MAAAMLGSAWAEEPETDGDARGRHHVVQRNDAVLPRGATTPVHQRNEAFTGGPAIAPDARGRVDQTNVVTVEPEPSDGRGGPEADLEASDPAPPDPEREIPPETGRLPVEIDSIPEARIEVDGIDVGTTPRTEALRPGRHVFRAHTVRGHLLQRTLEIGPERRRVQFYDLSEPVVDLAELRRTQPPPQEPLPTEGSLASAPDPPAPRPPAAPAEAVAVAPPAPGADPTGSEDPVSPPDPEAPGAPTLLDETRVGREAARPGVDTAALEREGAGIPADRARAGQGAAVGPPEPSRGAPPVQPAAAGSDLAFVGPPVPGGSASFAGPPLPALGGTRDAPVGTASVESPSRRAGGIGGEHEASEETDVVGLYDEPHIEVPLNSRGLRIAKRVKSLREIRRENVTFQAYDYSCGAAVVSTLLTYFFGDPADEETVITGLARTADLRKVSERRAFSLLDIKKFALARGYEAVGYQMDLEFLASLPQPVIVPIEPRGYKHFVVVKGIVGDRVYIADPAFGNYTRRLGRFLGEWSPQVGFVVHREDGSERVTDEDLQRYASFMGPVGIRGLAAAASRSVFRKPDQVQTIEIPRPLGGSPLDFFGIETDVLGQ